MGTYEAPHLNPNWYTRETLSQSVVYDCIFKNSPLAFKDNVFPHFHISRLTIYFPIFCLIVFMNVLILKLCFIFYCFIFIMTYSDFYVQNIVDFIHFTEVVSTRFFLVEAVKATNSMILDCWTIYTIMYAQPFWISFLLFPRLAIT